MLHFFSSFPPPPRVHFRFDPEKKKIGGERLGEEEEVEKDPKNIESHHILPLPLKRYRSRALMDSLMERLSLEVP